MFFDFWKKWQNIHGQIVKIWRQIMSNKSIFINSLSMEEISNFDENSKAIYVDFLSGFWNFGKV